MENTPKEEAPKTNNILADLKFTDEEKKEKLFLEFHYMTHKFESQFEDKKKQKEFKNIATDLENSMKEILNYSVSPKTIQNYISLKESAFDPDMLRLAKFLK